MHLESQNRKQCKKIFCNFFKFHNSIKKKCHCPLTRFEAMWPPGAKEDELDPLPWLNVSALVSLSAFLCSLFIYKIIKRRQDILWFTSTTVIDLYKRGKFVKKLLARSVFSRTSKLGILAGNHRSRVESSANGKFHNYFFWPFPHICRETFFVYAGKLS